MCGHRKNVNAIWLEKLDWDDKLPNYLFQKWSTFHENFTNISAIRILRWIQFRPDGEVQFYCFCDASEKAFAAWIYVRISLNDNVHTHLLTAKCKLASVKTVSLPRLELCGYVSEILLPEMGIDTYTSFFWTDSTISSDSYENHHLSGPSLSQIQFLRLYNVLNSLTGSMWTHMIILPI